MRQLSNKVSIVPVIAKSDCLTQNEIGALKRKILQEIHENNIKIYSLPDCDRYIIYFLKVWFQQPLFLINSRFSDEDEDYKQQVQNLRESIPFAVVGANAMVDVRGKKIRGRLYPWGVVEVENPAHCDFVKLRTMLITHMQDLQEVTHDVHYENFRSHRLAKPNPTAGAVKRPPPINDDKDKILQEKEAELRRMQEMVAAMQKQIKQQSQTSLASMATTNWIFSICTILFFCTSTQCQVLL